ncbi:MAG: hypothetical protein CBD61_02520 [Pelagibacteraceae bacterium TMED201]|nr:MAG: hypothetical protein CBD61_02520 [Pelagibacteraceae bacterium TMED201]
MSGKIIKNNPLKVSLRGLILFIEYSPIIVFEELYGREIKLQTIVEKIMPKIRNNQGIVFFIKCFIYNLLFL